jgi:hypothetical protein
MGLLNEPGMMMMMMMLMILEIAGGIENLEGKQRY